MGPVDSTGAKKVILHYSDERNDSVADPEVGRSTNDNLSILIRFYSAPKTYGDC